MVGLPVVGVVAVPGAHDDVQAALPVELADGGLGREAACAEVVVGGGVVAPPPVAGASLEGGHEPRVVGVDDLERAVAAEVRDGRGSVAAADAVLPGRGSVLLEHVDADLLGREQDLVFAVLVQVGEPGLGVHAGVVVAGVQPPVPLALEAKILRRAGVREVPEGGDDGGGVGDEQLLGALLVDDARLGTVEGTGTPTVGRPRLGLEEDLPGPGVEDVDPAVLVEGDDLLGAVAVEVVELEGSRGEREPALGRIGSVLGDLEDALGRVGGGGHEREAGEEADGDEPGAACPCRHGPRFAGRGTKLPD